MTNTLIHLKHKFHVNNVQMFKYFLISSSSPYSKLQNRSFKENDPVKSHSREDFLDIPRLL